MVEKQKIKNAFYPAILDDVIKVLEFIGLMQTIWFLAKQFRQVSIKLLNFLEKYIHGTPIYLLLILLFGADYCGLNLSRIATGMDKDIGVPLFQESTILFQPGHYFLLTLGFPWFILSVLMITVKVRYSMKTKGSLRKLIFSKQNNVFAFLILSGPIIIFFSISIISYIISSTEMAYFSLGSFILGFFYLLIVGSYFLIHERASKH
jgi:hypothetical protein